MSIGIWQIALVLLIVVIVFGVGKLPRVMGDMGKGVRNFKEGLKGEDDAEKADDAATPKINADSSQTEDRKTG